MGALVRLRCASGHNECCWTEKELRERGRGEREERTRERKRVDIVLRLDRRRGRRQMGRGRRGFFFVLRSFYRKDSARAPFFYTKLLGTGRKKERARERENKQAFVRQMGERRPLLPDTCVTRRNGAAARFSRPYRTLASHARIR